MSGGSAVGTILEGARAVLFDAGNTLALPDWPRVSAVARRVFGRELDVRDAQARMCRVLAEADADEGFLRRVAEKAVAPGWDMRRVFEGLGVEGDRLERLMAALDEEHGRRHLWSVVNPDAPPVLRGLKARGLRLGVISNSADGKVGELLREIGALPYLDSYVDSYHAGLAKPDPNIFLRAAGELGVAPGEAAYVGDSYHSDVVGAEEAGLRGVLYDPLGLSRRDDVREIQSLSELH